MSAGFEDDLPSFHDQPRGQQGGHVLQRGGHKARPYTQIHLGLSRPQHGIPLHFWLVEPERISGK